MGAPKGNKYGVGHGRPPIYEDTPENVEKVAKLVDEYFEWIKGEEGERDVEVPNTETGDIRVIKETYWIRKPEPPTVTGLTLYLGFADKTTLYDYKDKKSFSHSIKRGLAKIEQHHEFKIAHGDKCTGNIFALKNFGWTDRSEIDHNIKSEQPLFGPKDE